MKEQKGNTNLADHYLSFQETHRIASNLNRIEAERERQRNPTSLDFFLWLVGGIVMMPVIIYFAYELLTSASTAFEFVIIIVGALFAVWLDFCFTLGAWRLLRK